MFNGVDLRERKGGLGCPPYCAHGINTLSGTTSIQICAQDCSYLIMSHSKLVRHYSLPLIFPSFLHLLAWHIEILNPALREFCVAHTINHQRIPCPSFLHAPRIYEIACVHRVCVRSEKLKPQIGMEIWSHRIQHIYGVARRTYSLYDTRWLCILYNLQKLTVLCTLANDVFHMLLFSGISYVVVLEIFNGQPMRASYVQSTIPKN